jgi:N-acetylmuramoyl-L-alanine amidase
VPLRKRYQKAEDAKAELFISIHADSHRSRSVRGASVYSLSEKSSDREAAALARRENRSDIIAGIDLSSQSDTVASILIGLRQRQTMNESALFGEILISELARDIKVLRNTHRFAGFAVLKSPDIPSVLIELGYLSNPADEGKFRNSDFYNRLSGAILRSVEKYFARKTRLSRS